MCNSTKIELGLIGEKLRTMVDETRFEAQITRLCNQAAELERHLDGKLNVKEALEMFDRKSDTEDVNGALETIESSLSTKLDMSRFDKALK